MSEVVITCCPSALEAGLTGPDLWAHLFTDHRDELPSELLEPIDNLVIEMVRIVSDLGPNASSS